MLSKEEIEQVRNHLKNDPFNWPAHKLMDHINDIEEKEKQHSILQAKFMLQSDGFNDEECEKIMNLLTNSGTIVHESVKCFVCDGRGHKLEMGCMGGHFDRCSKCHGSGSFMRIKVPE
jgi:DnaJ-class molecular chaperone